MQEIVNHRGIKSSELEGTSKGYLFQLPCNAHRDTDAQGLIQLHPESLQGWGINR